MHHEATMRRVYELISAGDVDGFGEMLADDFVEHEQLPGFPMTKAGVKEYFRMLTTAFPDLRFTAEEILASGDKVVSRVTVTGTQKGDFMGVPATGKSVTVQAIDIVRIDEDGLGREHWGVFDAMSLMQQLGAVPVGAPA